MDAPTALLPDELPGRQDERTALERVGREFGGDVAGTAGDHAGVHVALSRRRTDDQELHRGVVEPDGGNAEGPRWQVERDLLAGAGVPDLCPDRADLVVDRRSVELVEQVAQPGPGRREPHTVVRLGVLREPVL